jgi:hypothetical protein
MLSLCGHTERVPNPLPEQVFSMANAALIKAERNLNSAGAR